MRRLIPSFSVHSRLPGSKGKSTKTFHDELWKRVFWQASPSPRRYYANGCSYSHRFLVAMDRHLCTFLGRPSAISSEDIEIDYPEECDDEYWLIEGENVTFHQPPGLPALPAAFNVHLKLCELFAVSTRTLYASPKSRALFGVTGEDWVGCFTAKRHLLEPTDLLPGSSNSDRTGFVLEQLAGFPSWSVL